MKKHESLTRCRFSKAKYRQPGQEPFLVAAKGGDINLTCMNPHCQQAIPHPQKFSVST